MTSSLPLKKLSIGPVLAVAWLLAAAAPANALYIVTPLRLSADASQVDVGDQVHFTIDGQNETEEANWAGKVVSVRYGYDKNEGAESGDEGPDAPVGNDGWTTGLALDGIVLDERAHATFKWTIPAELDRHNVDVTVVGEDGEVVAVTHLAVGDAPPAMRILAGSGPSDGREIDDGSADATPDGAGADDSGSGSTGAPEEGARDAPGPAALAVLGMGTVAALAGALRRRR